VTDHSMKLYIREKLALLNEATHSVEVLSVRERMPTGEWQVNEFNNKFIKTSMRGVL